MTNRFLEHISEEWLAAYYDHELQGSRLNQVETHLAQCEVCRSQLDELNELSNILQWVPEPEYKTSPERFASQVLLRLPRSKTRPVPGHLGKLAWQTIPLGILVGWAFVQAVFLISPLALALLGGLPEGSYLALGLPALTGSDLWSALNNLSGVWDLLEPFLDFIGIYIILTVMLAGLLWGWLASWWVIKKAST